MHSNAPEQEGRRRLVPEASPPEKFRTEDKLQSNLSERVFRLHPTSAFGFLASSFLERGLTVDLHAVVAVLGFVPPSLASPSPRDELLSLAVPSNQNTKILTVSCNSHFRT